MSTMENIRLIARAPLSEKGNTIIFSAVQYFILKTKRFLSHKTYFLTHNSFSPPSCVLSKLFCHSFSKYYEL